MPAYELSLLEPPKLDGPTLQRLLQSPPPGVSTHALAEACAGRSAFPVAVGRFDGRDAALTALHALQALHLSVCILDRRGALATWVDNSLDWFTSQVRRLREGPPPVQGPPLRFAGSASRDEAAPMASLRRWMWALVGVAVVAAGLALLVRAALDESQADLSRAASFDTPDTADTGRRGQIPGGDSGVVSGRRTAGLPGVTGGGGPPRVRVDATPSAGARGEGSRSGDAFDLALCLLAALFGAALAHVAGTVTERVMVRASAASLRRARIASRVAACALLVGVVAPYASDATTSPSTTPPAPRRGGDAPGEDPTPNLDAGHDDAPTAPLGPFARILGAHRRGPGAFTRMFASMQARASRADAGADVATRDAYDDADDDDAGDDGVDDDGVGDDTDAGFDASLDVDAREPARREHRARRGHRRRSRGRSRHARADAATVDVAPLARRAHGDEGLALADPRADTTRLDGGASTGPTSAPANGSGDTATPPRSSGEAQGRTQRPHATSTARAPSPPAPSPWRSGVRWFFAGAALGMVASPGWRRIGKGVRS